MITKEEIEKLITRQYEISNYDYSFAFGDGVITAAEKYLSQKDIFDLRIHNDKLFDESFIALV